MSVVPLASLLLPLLLAHCGDQERPSPRPPQSAAKSAAPSGRLVFLTDLAGYLEPCGCQSTSLGGVDRAVAHVRRLAQDGVPMAIVAVGDLLFQPGQDHQRSDEDARTQELWKADTMVQVLSSLPLSAALSGEGDLQFGAEALLAATAAAPFPWYGSGRLPANQTARKRLSVGTLPIGLLLRAASLDEDGRKVGAELTQAAAELRKEGVQFVVAVVDGEARLTRQAAAVAKGVDALVASGRDRDDPSAPERVGETLLLSGGQHGRGLLVVEPTLVRRDQPFADVSAWTKEAEIKAERATIEDLEARIKAWEQDKEVDPKQLAEQRLRLTQLKSELSAVMTRTAADNRLDVRYIALPQTLPQAPEVTALMAAYDARVNEHNRTAFAGRKPPPVPEGQASYVGAEACKNCHAPAYAFWQSHAHGRAYDTLVAKHKEYNLSCVGCHLTGYEKPGGSTVTHQETLRHVGCEACHGPGSLHLTDPKRIVRTPTESTCTECHNAEHSDQFNFASYRARLLAPGHGLPLETTPSEKTP